MYAVITIGGKQHRVQPGDKLRVELMEQAADGDKIQFDNVLMLHDGVQLNWGAPFVEGAKVEAEVLEHGRHVKIRIIKMKRRKHHMKRMGHRQWFTLLEIKNITR